MVIDISCPMMLTVLLCVVLKQACITAMEREVYLADYYLYILHSSQLINLLSVDNCSCFPVTVIIVFISQVLSGILLLVYMIFSFVVSPIVYIRRFE